MDQKQPSQSPDVKLIEILWQDLKGINAQMPAKKKSEMKQCCKEESFHNDMTGC